MNRVVTVVALLTVLLAAPSSDAQGKIEPGEWEQVMTVTAPGMPGGSVTRTMRQCFTSADVAIFGDREQWAKAIEKDAADADCKLAKVEQDGTAMVVHLACAADTRMQMRHDFQGTTGTIDTETFSEGVSMGKSHVESKRIAATCSEESIAQWKQLNPGRTFAP